MQQFFFILFFLREISEVRGTISAKFCHMVGSMFNLQMPVQKFGNLPPKKIWGAKNALNLARFRTPSNFEREYLQNGQKYPLSKIGKLFDRQHFLPRLTKKSLVNFGPLTTEFVMCNCTHKIDFSEYHILASRGCCARNFYTPHRMATYPTGDGGSPTIF